MKKIKLALAQVESFHGNKEKNLEKALNIIKTASEKKADIVIFPELFYFGYFNKRKIFHDLAEYNDRRLYMELKRAAIKYNIFIVMGYVEKKKSIPDKIFNSIIFIDNKGNRLGSYNKYYCWGAEKKTFAQGDDISVYKTSIGNIGLLNCYDIEFPELFRILSLKGAELVICSAVWSKWIQHRWHNSLISGAATNLYFVAGVNTIGTTPKGSVICGDTKVINPFGEVIIKASEDKEEVIYKTIDLDEVKKMREEYPIWKDFRKDMYKDKILDFEK